MNHQVLAMLPGSLIWQHLMHHLHKYLKYLALLSTSWPGFCSKNFTILLEFNLSINIWTRKQFCEASRSKWEFILIKELVGRATRLSKPSLHLLPVCVDYCASCFGLFSSPLQNVSHVPALPLGFHSLFQDLQQPSSARVAAVGVTSCRNPQPTRWATHWLMHLIIFSDAVYKHLGAVLFLIFTIPCEILTCMVTHSSPLPKPFLGRWGSSWGHWRVIEPLIKTKRVTWWRNQEKSHP